METKAAGNMEREDTHNEDLKSELSSYLAQHNSMVISTSEGDRPWAAAVFYVHDLSFNFYFLSEDKTRHSANILANGRVAATVNDDPKDWREIRGVQLEGTATKVTSTLEKTKALALYLRKFPFVLSFLSSTDNMLSGMVIGGKRLSFSVYKVKAERIFYLDNRKGFSHREELNLGKSD